MIYLPCFFFGIQTQILQTCHIESKCGGIKLFLLSRSNSQPLNRVISPSLRQFCCEKTIYSIGFHWLDLIRTDKVNKAHWSYSKSTEFISKITGNTAHVCTAAALWCSLTRPLSLNIRGDRYLIQQSKVDTIEQSTPGN